MKLSKKTIIISSLAIIFFVILIAVLVIVRVNTSKPKTIIKALQDTTDVQIKDFVYTEVGKNKSKWEVKADSAIYDKKQNLAVLEMVKIKLVTSNGKVFNMKADQGRINTDRKTIEIGGHVLIDSDDGDVFSTDYIKYDDAEKKFYTEAPVTMKNQRMKITGKGLVIYMNKGELNIPSMVKAIIH
jgi:LPS export ABC transporter protein LptC